MPTCSRFSHHTAASATMPMRSAAACVSGRTGARNDLTRAERTASAMASWLTLQEPALAADRRRERHGERRSGAGGAGDADGSAEDVDGHLAEDQAEAGVLAAVLAPAAAAVLDEQHGLVRRRDAASAVVHLERNAAVGVVGHQADGLRRPAVAEGVDDQ